MYKQASGRNQRTKGFKVKHALQVCLLVAVCVWLLYQVKHSHDKKRALEERNTKISTAIEESNAEILRFGRKDLPQVSIETGTENETHNDEEGNEEAEESEQENKSEESEEARGAGDDEIDENDQERADEEAEQGEELGDEEDKEGHSDELSLLDNQDHDKAEANSQEAREEHYKGDDASSAVVRDTETIESEVGSTGAGRMDEEQVEDAEKKDLEFGNKTNGTEDRPEVHESVVVPEEGEIRLSNNTSENATPLLEGEHETGSLSNSTTDESNYQIKQEINSTADNQLNGGIEMQNNSTVAVAVENNGLPMKNVSMVSGLAHDQNSTTEMGKTGENTNSNLEEGNSNPENVVVEQTEKSNMANGAEGLDESSTTSSDTSERENIVQVDSNDSPAKVDVITEEERDARTDLSTLPDTQTETKIEELAAE